MSAPEASPSAFPIFRADLNQTTSTKLIIDEAAKFEHIDDDNYVRNKVQNISVSIVKNAKLNRKTAAFHLHDLGTVEAILAGLQANFPDTQFKLYPPNARQANNMVRAFWS